MKQFQTQLPLLFNILNASRLETCLPEAPWKGLFLFLSDKAQVPFRNAEELNTGDAIVENGLCRYLLD